MKRLLFVVAICALLSACAPTPEQLAEPLQATLTAMPTGTPYPTNTPYPTLTPYPTGTPYPTSTPAPTIAVTRIIYRTPEPDPDDYSCKPIKVMEYSDNSRIAVLLQSYVAGLPGVRTVSYVIPEKLYNNSLSQLYYVSYIADEDGKVYSKRYIAYVHEFGWDTGVFSIDGQCWIHGPN